jgi:hypothetical protein
MGQLNIEIVCVVAIRFIQMIAFAKGGKLPAIC